MALVSEVIKAVPGRKLALHVFAPALAHRKANPGNTLPVMALRSSLHNYGKMRLYHRIDMLGPASFEEIFDNPLPGSGGNAVAIVFTEFPIQVWYEEGQPPATIDTDNRDPKDVLNEVLQRYTVVEF